MTVNANLIVQHVFKMKNRVIINVCASVTSIIRAKKIIVGIQAHVFVRIVGI